MIARGEGFGKIAGTGTRKMKELFIKNGWGDPAAAFRHSNGEQGAGIFTVHVEGVTGSAGRLCHDQQRARSMTKPGLFLWIW